ncbi:hypothetical protein [Actinomadura hibisca]|uniref:hypothetical protein n=1 Tax=Actinomadura hibisca TaxID=68565 RepID=UPI0008348F32|nr:hypothetical protein [Actinomadura hibisca]
MVERAIEQGEPRRDFPDGDPPAGPRPLPPVRLASPAELLLAARRTELHAMVRALVGWVRPGREVGPDGGLPPDGFAGLLDHLGDRARPAASGAAGLEQAVRRFWDALVEHGLLHVDAGRGLVWPGPAAASLDDPLADEALEVWRRFLITMVDLWGGVGRGRAAEEALTGNLLVCLYARNGWIPLDALAVESARPLVELHIGALTNAGLVEHAMFGIGVTPLGRYVCRALLQEASGQTIPVLGSYAGADAATLLRALTAYPVGLIPEEAAGWVAERTVESGIAEIRAALTEVGPTARRAGLDLLAGTFGDTFGPAGRRALAELAADPRLGALVRGVLPEEERERAPGAGRDADVWALIDLAVMHFEKEPPSAESLHGLGYVHEDVAKMAKLVALFGDCDHPGGPGVLDAIIAHHPDPPVVAAARAARERLPGPPA